MLLPRRRHRGNELESIGNKMSAVGGGGLVFGDGQIGKRQSKRRRQHAFTLSLSCSLFCASMFLFLGGDRGPSSLRRWLEEESIRFTGAKISTASASNVLQESEILLSTLQLYGIISSVMVLVYASVRRRYPRVFNVRGTAGMDSPMGVASKKAATMFDSGSSFSWIKQMFLLSHEEIYQTSGLDALALIRLLEFGTKLAIVGIGQSLYLFPIYYWIGESVYSEATASITDPVQNISLANMPPGHPGAIAATVSAYVLFGVAMYLIFGEYEWFTSYRHRHLTERRAENYSILVTGIPTKYRSDAAVLEYFSDCFNTSTTPNCVLEAHVVVDAPLLEKKIAERDDCVAKLEHAINIRNIKGGGLIGPTHRTGFLGDKVDSIQYYTHELNRLNDEVSQAIDSIEADKRERDASVSFLAGRGSPAAASPSNAQDISFDIETTISVVDSVTSRGDIGETSQKSATNTPSKSKSGSPQRLEALSALTFSPASESRIKKMESMRDSMTSTARSLFSVQDGTPKNAAFVTFSDLTTTNAALRMIEERPFFMATTRAPARENVNWNKLGLSITRLELGSLLSLVLTSALCLFWTIPVSFVASLVNVTALTEIFPALGAFLNVHPWFAAVIAQLAPLLLVVVVALLPTILQMISKVEGHTSLTGIQASLFSKLSWFTIIQTFFISAISGSVTQEIQNILVSPIQAVDLLAASLPSQSAYLMQIILVQTLLGGVGVELLRISAVGMASIRSCVGPKLTAKEKNTTFCGLRPFADPLEYLYARELGAEVILLFMVLFCYASMAPLTCYICGLCFSLLNIVLRNQFFFVYPSRNDSGGRLFLSFMNILVTCMIISQVALVGVLSLKKTKIAAPLLVPLPIITLLFGIYLKRKYHQVTLHVPTKVCVQVDKVEVASGAIPDFSFMQGKYLQPALTKSEKVKFPVNFDEKIASSINIKETSTDAKAALKLSWQHFLNKSPYKKSKRNVKKTEGVP